MGRFAFLAVGRFGPGFLKAHVHGSVNDRAALDFRTTQEYEFAFVKDALGRHLRFVVHT